jgi:predicted DNA-binding transcriptional regulator YafY
VIVLEPSARLLRLLSFLQTPRDWSGRELAERLDVDARTVRRDIEKLRKLGYPVVAVRGIAGYRLGAGATMPPLLLDDEEAIAVAVGLCWAAEGAATDTGESALRALLKIERVLPSRLRHRFTALWAATLVVPGGTAGADSRTLTAIAGAIRDAVQLRFDYQKHDGSSSLRHAEPHKLVSVGRRWYLLGWDTDRQDWRTYRVDRLRPRIPSGPRFVPRPMPSGGVAAFVTQGVSVAPYSYQAKVTVKAPIIEVAERISPAAGYLEVIDEQRCLLHLGANSYDDLAIHLGLLGFPFIVHEPEALIRHMRELAGRMAAATS